MINFITELTKKINEEMHSTPYNFDKVINIYFIDISYYPTNSYWKEWGGYYDNFVGTQMELYFSKFLLKVESFDDMKQTPFSLYIENLKIIDCGYLSDIQEKLIDGGSSSSASNNTIDCGNANTICESCAYFNIPKHPWLYPDYEVQYNESVPYLTAPLSPDKPSSNILRKINAKIKLETPSFSYKLSDNIAGITLNQEFGVSLFNNDGHFDDENEWNLFNTPIYIKKSFIDSPEYDDFKQINVGIINNINVSFDKMQVNAIDKFRSMDMPVCKLITNESFDVITVDKENIGKSIPIVYGRKRIKVQKLSKNGTRYSIAEKVTTVHGVYNKDGNAIPWAYYPDTNTLNVSNNYEVDSVDITGYETNRIGEIIVDLITKKTDITYIDSFWNREEVNNYKNSSAKINIVITGGDVKKAIQEILKNDLAFFIQQKDGKFTIRKYGETYAERNIQSYEISKKPDKNWTDASNNYFSSCVINYNYTYDNTYSSYLYNERENELEQRYRRRVLRTFDTDLEDINDVIYLSNLLSDRYSYMSQTLKVALGIDTSDFELLDTVYIDLNINNRQFNEAEKYFIKEMNPAQDILVLEKYNIEN